MRRLSVLAAVVVSGIAACGGSAMAAQVSAAGRVPAVAPMVEPGTVTQTLRAGHPVRWDIRAEAGGTLRVHAALALPAGLDVILAAADVQPPPTFSVSLYNAYGGAVDCSPADAASRALTVQSVAEQPFDVTCATGPLASSGSYQVVVQVSGVPKEADFLTAPLTVTFGRQGAAHSASAAPDSTPSRSAAVTPSATAHPSSSASASASASASSAARAVAGSPPPRTRKAPASSSSSVLAYGLGAAGVAVVGASVAGVGLARRRRAAQWRYITPAPGDPHQSAESRALHEYLPLASDGAPRPSAEAPGAARGPREGEAERRP